MNEEQIRNLIKSELNKKIKENKIIFNSYSGHGHNGKNSRFLRNDICFSAYLSANTAYNDDETIVFDTEIFDISSNYDKTTGIFTAPVEGYYNFTARAKVAAGGCVDQKLYGFAIVHNGTVVAQSILSASGTAAIGSVINKLIKCDAGDTIQITYNENATGAVTIEGSISSSYFCGYLLSA